MSGAGFEGLQGAGTLLRLLFCMDGLFVELGLGEVEARQFVIQNLLRHLLVSPRHLLHTLNDLLVTDPALHLKKIDLLSGKRWQVAITLICLAVFVVTALLLLP